MAGTEETRRRLLAGAVIPAHPLALTAERRLGWPLAALALAAAALYAAVENRVSGASHRDGAEGSVFAGAGGSLREENVRAVLAGPLAAAGFAAYHSLGSQS